MSKSFYLVLCFAALVTSFKVDRVKKRHGIRQLALSKTTRGSNINNNGECQKELVNVIGENLRDIKNYLGSLSGKGSNPEKVKRANEWVLAFRGTADVQKPVLAAYTTGDGIPSVVEHGCKQFGSKEPCSSHYRNNEILGNWSNIHEIAFVLYVGEVEVKRIIFDGRGSNYVNWFEKSRVKVSPWSDLMCSQTNFFSMEGDMALPYKRAFFINRQYGGCDVDVGWFVAKDGPDGICVWSQKSGYPIFLYARGNTGINWSFGDYGRADAFGIYVKFDNET